MIKIVRNSFLFVLAVVLMTGCLRYAPAIYPDDMIEPSKGYLYGRFSDARGFNLISTQIGIVVTSVDKKREIGLRFEPTLDPYAIAVEPGDYHTTHIVFQGGGGNDQRKPFPYELSGRVINVEAGKAYYLGDFDGTTKSTFLVLFTASEWRMNKIANDFAGTTAKLEELLPKMKGMPKVDVFGDAFVTAFSRTGAPNAGVSSSATPVVLPPTK
ncbi:MAG: hypothetical protein AABZ15_05440 [Nitrospirota bacterium]